MKLMKLNIQLFAIGASNSKTIYAPANSSKGYTLKASFSETSSNATNNTSTVSCTASLGASNISYSVSNGGTLAIYWHDNRENKDVLIKSSTINSCGMSYGTKSVSGSKTVYHNNDGTLSGYAKAVFTKGSGTYVPASGNISTANTALTKLPRAGKIGAVSGNIGSKPTITITPAASGLNYTYTVTYNVGGNSGTIQTKSATTSITTWTIPDSFYQTCSNVTQISGTIYCSTWSGNTQIGSTQSNTFTVKVPTSAKPTVRPLVIGTEIVDTDIVSRDVIQEFVVGRSKLQYNMANAYSSNYYATADKYTLKINNMAVTQNSTNSIYTRSDTIPGTSGTYEVIITDKRGNSGTSGVQNITAYAYNSPQCSFTIERDDAVASTVKINYSGSITNINNNDNNSKEFKMEYKITNPSAQDTWHTVFDITDSYSINNTTTLPNIDGDKTYTFVMTATDSYGDATKSTATIELPTSATLINFSANGDALAFGKASEIPNTFECNLKSDFKKEMNTSSLNVNGELNLYDENNKNNVEIFGLTGTPRYDSTQTYEKGAYVIYGNSLQKCIATTTGTFDSTKWEATDIMNETEKGIILYNNKSGSSSSISLSDNTNNYKYLEIIYGWHGGSYGLSSTKYDLKNGYDVNLSQIVYDNGNCYFGTSKWKASGTTFTLIGGEYWRIGTAPQITRSQVQQIWVYKILGYK